MYIDYDPMDAPDQTSVGEANVQRALSHKPTASGNAFEEATLALRVSNEPGRLYLDNDSNEERFTTVGTLYIVCMAPFAANVTLGQLFFDWTIRMTIPQEDPGVPSGDAFAATFSGTFDATHRWGTTILQVSGNSIDVNFDSKNAGDLKFPPGNFYVVAASTVATPFTTTDHLVFAVDPAITHTEYQTFLTPETSANAHWIEARWVSSTTVWTLRNAGTHYQMGGGGPISLMVTATSFSPIGNTWRATANIMRKAESAKKQNGNVDQVLSLMSGSTTSTSTQSAPSTKDRTWQLIEKYEAKSSPPPRRL
jgi:hypothetical protein